jgi:hypothetical protein
LIVTGAAPHDAQGKIRWDCLCDCGTIVQVRAHHLRAGATTSCGCGVRRDLLGQQFGQLVVTKRAPNVGPISVARPKGLTAWRCRCACGREVIATTEHLVRGIATHCGCKNPMLPTAPPSERIEPPPPNVPLRRTTSAEFLQRFHDEHSPLGRVRRIARPVDEDEDVGGVLHDFDPY